MGRDVIRIVELKGSRNLKYGLRFVENCNSTNLYLYEGLSLASSRRKSFLIFSGGIPVGVVHARGKYTLHLLFSKNVNKHTFKKLSHFIERKLPEINTFFGDSESINTFLCASRLNPVTARHFIFMEISKNIFDIKKQDWYHCPGVIQPVEPELAHILLPLQVKYEIEELGANMEEIEMHKILKLIKYRLKSGEITTIFDRSNPVGLAGVNAHFKDTCQIGSVYVLPQYRRKGYGFKLINAHLKKLFNAYKRVVLFVDKNNFRATNLYHKAGFRKAGKLMQVWI